MDHAVMFAEKLLSFYKKKEKNNRISKFKKPVFQNKKKTVRLLMCFNNAIIMSFYSIKNKMLFNFSQRMGLMARGMIVLSLALTLLISPV